VVRKTYFPGVDLIPACLALYEAEIALVLHIAEQETADARREVFAELSYGIQTVADNYDVVLLDSPPALGVISLNVLIAADALVVPTAAKMFDFSSTVQFFRMIRTYVAQLAPEKSYRWISVLTTLFDQRYDSQRQFVDVMRACFGSRSSSGCSFTRRSHQLLGAVRRTLRASEAEPESARDDGRCIRRDRARGAPRVAIEASGAQCEGNHLKGRGGFSRNLRTYC